MLGHRRELSFDAGVVACTVQAAIGRDRVSDHRVDLVGFRHVGLEVRGRAAVLADQFDCFMSSVWIDVGNDNFGPLFGELQRAGATNAGSSAGYQYNLARNKRHDATSVSELYPMIVLPVLRQPVLAGSGNKLMLRRRAMTAPIAAPRAAPLVPQRVAGGVQPLEDDQRGARLAPR